MLAADKVIEKAKPLAAHLLEASVDDLEFTGGRFTVQGHRQGAWRITEVALATFDRPQPTRRHGAELDADATYDPVNFSFPHGTHLCAMEVDTETGATTMRKYVCVDDIGNDHQPAHRRGPGARRPRAGHRAGAVGGRRVRRPGHPGHGLLRRLHPPTAADTISFVTDHTDLAVDDEHARHQGRRRGRHASPPPRRSSTPSWMPCATSASTTSRCRARPNGCGRPSRAPGRTPATSRPSEAQPHFADDSLNQDPSAGATDGAAQ